MARRVECPVCLSSFPVAGSRRSCQPRRSRRSDRPAPPIPPRERPNPPTGPDPPADPADPAGVVSPETSSNFRDPPIPPIPPIRPADPADPADPAGRIRRGIVYPADPADPADPTDPASRIGRIGRIHDGLAGRESPIVCHCRNFWEAFCSTSSANRQGILFLWVLPPVPRCRFREAWPPKQRYVDHANLDLFSRNFGRNFGQVSRGACSCTYFRTTLLSLADQCSKLRTLWGDRSAFHHRVHKTGPGEFVKSAFSAKNEMVQEACATSADPSR